jgi:hypothetical protein
MKSMLDRETRQQMMNRINSINENSPVQWGKMNVYQMLKHCRLFEEMIFSNKKYKQAFIGRIFGKMALRNVLKDEKPLRHNTPTLPVLRVKNEGDIATEKMKWIALIEEYANLKNAGFVHPFFGKMTRDQIGWLAYKHSDHHLRQFNG